MTNDFSDVDIRFLSTLSSAHEERRLTHIVLFISVVFFLLILPFAKYPLAPLPIFIPIYESVLVVIDLITAVLLFGQYGIVRSKALFFLACGYLYTGFIELAHGLSFPGGFAANGLIGGGTQTTAWLYIFWHVGFPLFVISYAMLKTGEGTAIVPSVSGLPRVRSGLSMVFVLALMASLIATKGNGALPIVIVGNTSTPALMLPIAIVWVLCGAALVLLWRRRMQSVLDQWLVIVMCAWLFDVGLSSLFNGGRYDLGYYAGRVYGCVATGFVLLKLLVQNGDLYARLLDAHGKATRKSRELHELSLQLEDANGLLAQRNQQLIEASQLKSEFLASMSHELRTPLNAIIGFSDVLKDGLVGELTVEQHEYVNDIYESGQHLLSLINDVLDLSKIEAGKMQLDLESMEVEPILRNGLAIVREKAALQHINLKLDLSGTLGTVKGDVRKTKQIIYNLLSNAVKFTPEHGLVTLSARIVERSEIENWSSAATTTATRPLPGSDYSHFLEISVTDTGRGISVRDAPRLFQAFTQLDSSLSRVHEGTGLGLVLVLKLVQLHQGTVALASSVDVGSCFTVWLPWRVELPDVKLSPTQAVNLRLLPLPKMDEAADAIRRALVIEDNQHAADLIALQLRSANFQVMHAENAIKAKEILASELPNLIILDILLPDMDGWDFLAQIKQGGSPLADIPVVIVSIQADKGQGMALGAAKVLQKPVTLDDLLTTLKELGLPEKGRVVTILFIDDDPKAIELLSTALQQSDCRILRAYGGADGIERCRRDRPDLVVLDLIMPEVSGFDVISALAEDPNTSSIPIVVVTAKSLSEEERQILNGRVEAIMEKECFDRLRFCNEIQRTLF